MKRCGIQTLMGTVAVLAFLGVAADLQADTIGLLTLGGKSFAGYDVFLNQGISDPAHEYKAGGDIYHFSNYSATPAVSPLPFVYCVDLTHEIAAGDKYYNTLGNYRGYQNENDTFTPMPNAGPVVALTVGNSGVLKNAQAIDYLLATYGKGVQIGSANSDVRGMQLALWQLVYGNKMTVVSANTDLSPAGVANNTAALKFMTELLHGGGPVSGTGVNYDPVTGVAATGNALGASDVNKVLWLNPNVDGHSQPNLLKADNDDKWAQALVTAAPNPFVKTPVPGTLVMSAILFGMFGLVWSYQRMNQRKSVA